jgi:ATP-dependent DNA ligase
MVRHMYFPYEHKRSKGLLKLKTFEDAEFKIVDVIEGVGNYAGMAKSLMIQLEDGSTQQCGVRGNQAYLTELLVNKQLYINGIAIVIFQNRTGDGKLLFPSARVLFYSTGDV